MVRCHKEGGKGRGKQAKGGWHLIAFHKDREGVGDITANYACVIAFLTRSERGRRKLNMNTYSEYFMLFENKRSKYEAVSKAERATDY